MKFALFFTLWVSAYDGTDSGTSQVWVLDHNMTGADCIALLEDVTPAYALMGDGTLSCEEDHASEF